MSNVHAGAQPRRLVAVVPVRGGSQGLPGKNVRELAGHPLYEHSVRHASDAGVDLVVITTDIQSILEKHHGPGVVVHRRPDHLCGPSVPMSPVLADVVSRREFDNADVVLLQATSPLRRTSDVKGAVGEFRRGGHELVMTVQRAPSSVLKSGVLEHGRFRAVRRTSDLFSNRQDLPDVFQPNGAVYVFDAELIRENGSLDTDRIGVVMMSPEDSFDIDTEEDFEMCVDALRARGALG